MKKLVFLLLYTVILISCSPTDAQVQEAIEKTSNAASTQTAGFKSPTSKFTATSTITSTPTITNTPEPTNTPRPTYTPTPKPDPIIIEGTGDDVVEINKWDGPAIVDVTSKAGRHFSVITYSDDGEYLDLLVNTIGPYEGKVTMDLLGYQDEQTSLIEVSANGDWSLAIFPFDRIYLNQMDAPGFYENDTDDVIVVDGNSKTATFNCDDHHFAVWGITDEGDVDLLVNEVAPYEGKVIIPKGLLLLIVTAEAYWSAELQ